jgi:hypothetical protein
MEPAVVLITGTDSARGSAMVLPTLSSSEVSMAMLARRTSDASCAASEPW